MTPTAADILIGNARVVAALATGEAGPDYVAAKLAVVAMLSVLAAQEVETGVAVRVAENAAIAAMLETQAETTDLSITALDRVNADLRRRLIAAHDAAQPGSPRDRAILALYRRMAAARVLVLPAG